MLASAPDQPLATRAGSALFWQGVEQVGLKVLVLGRTILLARLLAPEDFGLLAISMVALTVLLSLSDPGMLPALVQQKESREQYDVAWSLGVARALLVGAILFVAAPTVARLYREEQIVNLLRVLALRPIIDSFASIRVAALVRTLQFHRVARVRLAGAVAETVVSLTLAPFVGVWALVAGPLAGAVASTGLSYRVAPYVPTLRFHRDALRALVGYGRWIFLTGAIAVVAPAVVYLALSRQAGAAEVGLYFLAAKLAFLPYESFSTAVAAVAFPTYSSLQQRADKATAVFRANLSGLLLVLVPTSVLLMVLAPALVEHVLGPRWEGTVWIIRVLSMACIVGIVGDAAVPLLKGFGVPERVTVLEAVQSVVVIGLVWSFVAHWGTVGAACAVLVGLVCLQPVGALFAQSLLRRPFSGLGVVTVAVASASTFGGAVSWGVQMSIPGLVGLVTGAAVGAVSIIATMAIFDRAFQLGLLEIVGRLYPQALVFWGTLQQRRGIVPTRRLR